MKDSVKILAIGLVMASGMALAMWLPSRSQELPAALTTEDISWIEFCKSRGYDFDDKSPTVVDEFLDTWCGSTEEEEDLTRKGLPA